MKQSPFLTGDTLAYESSSWRRRDLILAAGGFYIRPSVFLRLNGRNVVWCDRDEEGRLELNIDIRDREDKPIILMQSDDWLEIRQIESFQDIERSPSGHALIIKAPTLGLSFAIKFRELTYQKLRRLGQTWHMELESRPGLQEPLPAWMIEAMERSADLPLYEHLRQHLPTLRQLTQTSPTRWELLTAAVSEPVNVCTMSLSMRYPFQVDIRPGSENVGGWCAGHTIAFDSKVVWDIQL